MNYVRIAASLAIVSSVAPISRAFAPSPDGTGPTDTSLPINQASTLTHSTAAHLDPDRVLDAIVLENNIPIAVFGPSAYRQSFSLVNTFSNDVATLRGLAPGGSDVVVLAESGAVVGLWWIGGTSHFQTNSLAGTGAFVNATRIRVADLAGDGSANDVIALGADKRTIASFTVTASSLTASSQTAGPGFTSPRDVLDIVPLHWDTDATPELALLTTLGVEIYDLAGNRITYFRGTTTGDLIVPIKDSSLGGRDRLAWVSPAANTSGQTLTTVDSTGIETILSLGSTTVGTAMNGDYDGDGRDDLVLSLRSSQQALVLINRGSTPGSVSGGGARTFDPTNPGTLTMARSNTPANPDPGNSAVPICADFDDDTDIDVMYPVLPTNNARSFRNPRIDYTTQVPHYPTSLNWLNPTDHTSDAVPTTPGRIELTNDSTSTIPTGATHIELTVWQKASFGGTNVSDSVQHTLVAISSGGNWFADVYADSATYFTGQILTVVARYVTLDSSGNITKAFPARVDCFSGDAATLALLDPTPGQANTTPVTYVPQSTVLAFGPLAPAPFLGCLMRCEISSAGGGSPSGGVDPYGSGSVPVTSANTGGH